MDKYEEVKHEMSRMHIRFENRIGLKLIQAECSLLLECLLKLGTLTNEPVTLTFDDLDELDR